MAGLVFSFASVQPLWLVDKTTVTSQAVYGTFAMGSALVGANMVVVAILFKIKYDRSVYETYKKDVEPYLFPDVLNVLTAGGSADPADDRTHRSADCGRGAIGSQVLVYRSREQVKRTTNYASG